MAAEHTHRKFVNFLDSDFLLGSAETNAAGVSTFMTETVPDSTRGFAAPPNEWTGKASSASAPSVAAGDTAAAQSSSFTVSTAPPITVANGATVEIDGVSAQSVTFTGTTGTLKLDDAPAFMGHISGLTGADAIDLADISYGANTKATFSGNARGGTLTVTNGTQTANIALSGNYLTSGWTLSSDGHGGTIVVDPPLLPSGVTLQPIDGGPTYYADHGFTNAVNMGWDSPNFFPIGPFDSSYNSQTDVNTWSALGWNTDFGDGGITFSLAASHGISVIEQNYAGSLPSNVVGLITQDEPSTFAEGVSTPLGTTANSIQDGRFWWMNDTWSWVWGQGLSGAPVPGTPASILSDLVKTPDGTTRHIDINTIDMYWFAGSRDPSWSGYMTEAGQLIYNLSSGMTPDQSERGSNYGDMIDIIRGYEGSNPAPIYTIIEDGQPFTGSTNGSTYITPPELNWATWSSLIHGARGVIYFDHSFSGPGTGNVDVENPYFQTVQPGQTISIDGQITATDALVEQLAPVLNSPFALNYVTVSPAGYTYNTPTLSLSGGIEVMAKDYNGQFYIFTDTRDSETQSNIPATFTIADLNATSVTVVGENRTIPVVNGVFTDTFATAATVHIYEVNDGAPPPPSPTISSIVESPASGDLNAGKTVTLTLLMGEAMTVSGGKPTLTLNDVGTATYSSGSGTNALVFTYTVAAGQNTSALAITSVNLPAGTTITDGSGHAAGLSLTGLTQTGPQIDTTAPAAPVISGDTVNVNTVTLTGTAEANSTITVFDNSTQLGTTATNSSGAWTFTTGALANGSQSFTGTATDSAGNVSPLSSAFVMTLTAPVNLVVNGSFETDSFTGWTLGGNYTSTTYGPEIFITNEAESGQYAAGMGPVGSDGTLSQTLQTTPGQQYTLNFWLKNDGAGPDDFSATWNGTTLLALTSAAAQNYTQYTYTVTATSSTTVLKFSARQDPSRWNLDNISVTPVGTQGTTPTVAVSINSTDVNLAHNTATVTFTFSAAPTSFGLSDVTYSGGTLGALTQVNPTTYTALFTAAANTDIANASVSVTAGSWQSNGNAGAGGSTPTFTVDTVTPTVAVSINSTDVNLAHNTATVTFTFSEAPTSFGLSDVTYSGGTLGALTQVNPTTYTALFMAAANTDISTAKVSVTGNSWSEVNGNPGSGGSTPTFTVDTVTPTVAVSINSTDVNLAHNTATVTFTFSEAPTAFGLSDVTYSGGTLGALTQVNSTTYTALFTAAANTDISTAKVSVTANSWSEVNGNPGSGGSTPTFTVDTVTPTVAVSINNTDVNVANGTGMVTFAFSEAPVTFVLADTSAVGGTLSNLQKTDATHYTATFTGAANTDISTAKVSVTANSWSEVNGNPGSGGSTPNFTVDTVTPTAPDPDGSEAPVLTINSRALTVNAGGSISLPIGVTAVDSDDTISVKISGLTKYETITDNLDHKVFSGHSVTLTAAEVNSGLTLNSTYGGSGHPVNTLTVTASNQTSGERGTSAVQTIAVTDPPAGSTSSDSTLTLGAPPASVGNAGPLAALLTQYAAAGFQSESKSGSGGGAVTTTPNSESPIDHHDSVLTKPMH